MRRVATERARLLVLLLCATSLLASKCGGPSTSVVLATETTTIGTGETFTVEIAVSTSTNVQAYDLSVSWDPAYVQPTSLSPHAEFDDDGLFFVPAVWGTGSIEGIVDLRHGGSGKTGTFRIATLEFVSLSQPGSTAIEVAGDGVARPNGAAPQVGYQGLTLQIAP
jgi:hypothetical protein